MFTFFFKTFLLSLLCFSLLSDAVNVRGASELINLFKAASGSTLDVPITILADLDFSQSGLTLPLGAFSNGTCVAYSGVLHGNGHTIKGLVMNNQQKSGYDCAGLFCSLKGASVDNLIFDSSCSFSGSSAGSLSAFIIGSASVTNVTNKADVSGYEGVGGFVGRIRYMDKGSTVSFNNCANQGTVSGTGYIGGFIGRIPENVDIRLVISNSVNDGDITAKKYGAGGFVGYIYENTNIAVSMSKCINNGHVKGDSGIGGLVGQFSWDDTRVSTLQIAECTSNGPVSGDGLVGGFVGKVYRVILDVSRSTNNAVVNRGSYGYVGGFVGYVDVDTSVKISSSTNNAAITCEGSYVAGFIGYASAYYPTQNVSLVLLNCANKGSSLAKKGMACGLCCISPEYNEKLTNTIVNSINKGSVSASQDSFGITNLVTKATNVVSMGDVSDSSNSNSFWGTSSNVDLFYGLEDKCVNCGSDTTLFKYNSLKQVYEVVWNGKRVHDLLNIVSSREHYGMLWTSDLDLFETKA